MTRRRARALVGWALVGALVSTRPARAQHAPGSGASTRAAELFEEGRALFEKRQYEQACQRLSKSDELDPAIGTSGMVAACEEKLGHLATAYAAYVETAERAQRAQDARGRYAKERATALAPRVPRLTVRLADGSPAGTRVLRDGVELHAASLGVDLPVDPGPHALEAQAAGRRDSKQTIELHEAERRTVTLSVGEEIAAPAPSPPSEPRHADAPRPSSNPLRTAGWIAGGVGIAGIGVASVSGVVVLGKKGTLDDHCSAGSGMVCDATGIDAREAVRPWLAANTVGWIVGAAGLSVGVVLLLLSRPDAGARAGLVMAPGRASLAVEGRF